MPDTATDIFEIGPIRPPSEAGSLLVRVTRNCPWNKCRFCRIYKKSSFQTRPMADIERDIDNIARIRDTLSELGFADGRPDYARLRAWLSDKTTEEQECCEHVAHWMLRGGQTAFLQDANTMVLSFDKLIHILTYLRTRLPEIRRVTTYGRVDSLARLTTEQYAALREAGLDRIHSGFETGSDNVLRMINKGYTKTDEIEAGQRIKKAGIELSVYFMPGVGGREYSRDNAVETADVISRVNPDFVRIRTFVCLPGTGLMDDLNNGLFTECTDMEKLLELKLMLQHIENADGTMYSDHVVNLLEGVRGNLTADKPKMLELIESVERLPENERKRFQLARRMALISDPSELSGIDERHRGLIEQAIEENINGADWEKLLHRLMKRYI